VNDVIDLGKNGADGFKIADICLVKINLAAHRGKVFIVAGGKIIENADGFAPSKQFRHNMRTDKTRATRYQIKSQALPPEFRTDEFITSMKQAAGSMDAADLAESMEPGGTATGA
jgi:hypothetical protein